MTSRKKKVLVAGASGLVGHAAVAHFASLPDWEVVAVSRRIPDDLPGATLLSVDLTDAAACERAFGGMSDVTHVVYAALKELPGLMPGWVDEENIESNGVMLRNLYEPLARATGDGMEHISLLHGTKAYGGHVLGREGMHNPLRERDPRRPHRNFYFVQEDYLLEQQAAGAKWGLTVFRPTVIYGDAGGNNMNPIPAIAAYAAILRERGEPLHFPGRGDQPALREAVDADLVARALEWAATSANARGGTYNLTNGDVFMWQFVWPAIAETLGMELGESRPMTLLEELPKLNVEWAAIVDKYGLTASKDVVEFVGYNSLVYADNVLSEMSRGPVPTINSTIEARQAGFHDCIDTEDMFRKWFARIQETHIIPTAEEQRAARAR
ncbi:MAG: NAD-dependent epimerase/dehydratase family protein [Chloroflexi bacterium]|nr:NAD-dependent epimerase/dehydratase family protein [Chloroflexota bacterium]